MLFFPVSLHHSKSSFVNSVTLLFSIAFLIYDFLILSILISLTFIRLGCDGNIKVSPQTSSCGLPNLISIPLSLANVSCGVICLPAPVYSVASGLDYPSSGPEHAFLHDIGRVKYDVVTDDETIDAFFELSRMEGIIPAIESSHAVAYGMKLARTMGKGSVLINLSGRGDKDMDYIIEKYGIR